MCQFVPSEVDYHQASITLVKIIIDLTPFPVSGYPPHVYTPEAQPLQAVTRW